MISRYENRFITVSYEAYQYPVSLTKAVCLPPYTMHNLQRTVPRFTGGVPGLTTGQQLPSANLQPSVQGFQAGTLPSWSASFFARTDDVLEQRHTLEYSIGLPLALGMLVVRHNCRTSRSAAGVCVRCDADQSIFFMPRSCWLTKRGPGSGGLSHPPGMPRFLEWLVHVDSAKTFVFFCAHEQNRSATHLAKVSRTPCSVVGYCLSKEADQTPSVAGLR